MVIRLIQNDIPCEKRDHQDTARNSVVIERKPGSQERKPCGRKGNPVDRKGNLVARKGNLVVGEETLWS